MPDAPDFYEYNLASERHVLKDLGELAVRLGSPNTYDRSGVTAFQIDFSKGFSAVNATPYGTGGAVSLTTTPADTAGMALELISGSDSVHKVEVLQYFAPLYPVRHGLEMGIAFLTVFDFCIFNLWRFDGSSSYRAAIQWRYSDGGLLYLDDSNSYELFGTVDPAENDDGIFHNIKLVADPATDEYVRVLLDRHKFNLSGQGVYAAAASDKPQYRAQLEYYGRTGNNDVAILDHLIITTGEG